MEQQEQMHVVPCPRRNCLVVLATLDQVRHHLQDHIRGEEEEVVYFCKYLGCANFYRSYRGWCQHTRHHLLNGDDFHLHGHEGGEINDNQQLDNGNAIPLNVDGGGEIIDGQNHLHAEGGGVDGENNVLIPIAQRLLGDGDGNVSEESEESEESDGDDDAGGAGDPDFDELETLPDGSKDVRHAATKMIVSMRSSSAMSRVGVGKAMKGANLVLRVNNKSLKSKVSRYLTAVGLAAQPRALSLLSKFDSKPFLGMLSNKGQISAVKQYYNFIQPETVFINHRIEQRLGEDGYRAVPVASSYEYVSVKEILKMVASKPSLMEFVNSQRPSDDGVLRCYMDGNQYSRHPFFQEHPHAFQIALYYDGVDPARGLGPKSGLHEIGHFLIEILNMPPGFNSSLGALHTVVLANTLDCTGTFHAVLGRFVEEICELEDGVNMYINGQFTDIFATLVVVKADAKALHEILGFLACGARHFCNICMISRQELHDGQIMLGVLRTQDLIDAHLDEVQRNNAFSTQCGLKFRTCLLDIPSYFTANNRVTDLMHDGPHGLIMMLIRLCLKQFIVVEGLFDVNVLNDRIDSFIYGKQDAKDRPTSNFTLDSLRQADDVHMQKSNAAQTLVLFRALPFILDSINEDGAVSEDNVYLQYYLLFSKIWRIVAAPEIPRDVLPYLRHLLETFHRDWYNIFPGVNPINKFHHFMHAADNIEEMGPLRQFWCFRDEGKNCPIRRHISSTNSFKNPNKTSLEQNQVHQASFWGPLSRDDILKVKVTLVKRENVPVHTLPVSGLLQRLGFGPDYVIPIAKAAYVNGFEYRIGEFILHTKASNVANNLPHFARIVSVISPEDGVVWLGAQAWETDGLVERFNAFSVSLPCNAAVHLINVKDLPCHRPISRWRDYSTDGSFLCLRHDVY